MEVACTDSTDFGRTGGTECAEGNDGLISQGGPRLWLNIEDLVKDVGRNRGWFAAWCMMLMFNNLVKF